MSTIEGAPAAPGPAYRRVSPLLAIAIFLVPLIFAWLTLRKGYSATARVLAFCWLILSVFIFYGLGGASTSSTASNSSAASSQGGDNRTFSQVATDTMVAPQMNAITDKVARDAVDQYNISRSGGDKIQICVQSGLVAAAYLQAKNQSEYVRWKDTERADCAAAGMPQH